MKSVHLGKNLVLFYVLLLPGRISEQSFGAGNEDNSMFLSDTPTLKAQWRWDCSLCLLCKLYPAWNLYFLFWGKGGLGPHYFQWPCTQGRACILQVQAGIRRKLPPLGCTLPKFILSSRYWRAGLSIPISCHSQEDSFPTRSYWLHQSDAIIVSAEEWAVDLSSHTTESHCF